MKTEECVNKPQIEVDIPDDSDNQELSQNGSIVPETMKTDLPPRCPERKTGRRNLN